MSASMPVLHTAEGTRVLVSNSMHMCVFHACITISVWMERTLCTSMNTFCPHYANYQKGERPARPPPPSPWQEEERTAKGAKRGMDMSKEMAQKTEEDISVR